MQMYLNRGRNREKTLAKIRNSFGGSTAVRMGSYFSERGIQMKRSVYAALAAAMLAMISGGVVQAETTLDTVYVDANKESEQAVLPGGFFRERTDAGFLGNQDVMEVPFSTMKVDGSVLQKFASPYGGLSEALSFDPSVRMDRGGTYTDISIRGIYQSGHSFYVNGIPNLMDQQNIPTDWIESVSIISGPNLGVSGSTLSEAAGGTVNIQSKKAGETPITNLKLAYRGGESFEEAVDVGRRFGENGRYGIRVSANNIQGDTSIDGENVTQRNIFVNVDQHTDNSKTNVLVGYNYVDHKGGPGGISFGSGVTSLPSAPNSGRIYKPSWSYNEYDNWIAAVNHEQKLSEHATFFLNAGYHREDWYGYIDGNPTVSDNDGNFAISMTNYPLNLTKKYIGMGVKGTFNIGAVKNEYTVGVDKNWMTYALGSNPAFGTGGKWSGTGNLYKHNSWANPGITTYDPPHTRDQQLAGWHIVDTLKAMDDKLQIMLGLHGHYNETNNVGKAAQKSHAISPTYALSYRFTPNLTAYAAHTESFGVGALVPSSSGGISYANAGEILDPTKTKQNEIGVKVKAGNFLHTVSYFEIKQANNIDVLDGGLWYKRTDGTQKHKGFEWAATGSIGEKWDLTGGFMYIDAKDYKGQAVNGAAKWSATAGVIYHANDAWSILARATYLGSSTINTGKLDVPAYFKFDLGASYKTVLGHTPVTFNAMCYNVTDKDYWIARSGSSSLIVGAPRTFVLSAEFSL